MFNQFTQSGITNNKLKLYIIILIIIYVLCFTNIIPSEVHKLINKPIAKGIIFSYITFLSKTNLGGSLILTTIYFIITTCNQPRNKYINNYYDQMKSVPQTNVKSYDDTLKNEKKTL